MSSTRTRLRERLLQRSQRVDAHGPAAEMPRGVGDDRPHVLADRPAEQEQEAVLAPRTRSRRAGGRSSPAAVPATGVDLRAQVERAEAREHLAALRAHERQRGEHGRDVQRVDAVGACSRAAARRPGSPMTQRAVGRQRAPPGAVATGRGPELELERAGPRRGPAARACAGARRRTSRPSRAGHASCSAFRSRPRRSSRRAPRSGRRRRAPGVSIGLRATASASAAPALRNSRPS